MSAAGLDGFSVGDLDAEGVTQVFSSLLWQYFNNVICKLIIQQIRSTQYVTKAAKLIYYSKHLLSPFSSTSKANR